MPLPVQQHVEFQLRYYLNVGMDVSTIMLVCMYVFMCKYVEIYVETRGGGGGGGECVWRNA